MEHVKLGMILENACRLAGREASLVGVPEGWKVLAGMTLGEGLRTLAAEKFPAMQRVEWRRYRPEWNVNTVYDEGHEVWWEDKYWRRMASTGANSQAPSALYAPWRELQAGEVAAFIAFDQPWEATVMQSFGVDVTRFAYAKDPRYNPDAAPIKGCRLCELGVIIGGTPPPAKGVWVKFVPEYPPIDFREWSDKAEYERGETVYLTKTKEVYQYLGASGEEEPGAEAVPPDEDESGAWRPLRVRGEFVPYLTRLVAADLLTEDQGKYQTKAAAEAELERLAERYHEGNGETRVRTGRFR